jgi:hypothetical protein
MQVAPAQDSLPTTVVVEVVEEEMVPEQILAERQLRLVIQH